MNSQTNGTSEIQKLREEFTEMCSLADRLLERLNEQLDGFERVYQAIQSYQDSLPTASQIQEEQHRKLADVNDAMKQIKNRR